jgi:hypothetical protein
MTKRKVKKHPHRTLFTKKQFDFLARCADHMDLSISATIRLAVQNLRNKELKNLPDIIEE